MVDIKAKFYYNLGRLNMVVKDIENETDVLKALTSRYTDFNSCNLPLIIFTYFSSISIPIALLSSSNAPIRFKPVPLIVILIHDLRERIKEKIGRRARK